MPKLVHALGVEGPALGVVPDASPEGVPSLLGHALVEDRVLALKAKIVEISVNWPRRASMAGVDPPKS